MNKFLKTNDEKKRRRCDKIIHKAMILLLTFIKQIKRSMLQLKQKMHVNWNFHIVMATMY